MERKIGEIFEYNGEWYQCVKSPDDTCLNCDMNFDGKCPIPIKECVASVRSDLSHVIFKKLEKAGEPYIIGNKLIQRYKIYPTTYHINVYGWYYHNLDVKSWTIDIEIKQNKEDMEEKKLNLTPFDLESAKQGKPVCTRDGRKARVLCYDFKQNEEYPILVAVENKDGKEWAFLYSNDGISEMYKSSNNELMMFLEKKEGWVNVYKKGKNRYVRGIFHNKDKAIRNISEKLGEFVDTIKINWEE
jgi:hypothetical protein